MNATAGGILQSCPAFTVRGMSPPCCVTSRGSRVSIFHKAPPLYDCAGALLQSTLSGSWRSVRVSSPLGVAASLGLANRPLTFRATLHIWPRCVFSSAIGSGYWIASPILNFSRFNTRLPFWRRRKDSNPQTTNGDGFLDRSASSYGIHRHVSRVCCSPQAAQRFVYRQRRRRAAPTPL